MSVSGTILVVDDEPRVLMLLEVHLQRDGNRILCAKSTDAALKLMAGEPVDLVLTDIQMPGRSGLELMHEVRSLYGRDVTMVAMTAYGSINNREQALAAGADEYVDKPFDMHDIRRLCGLCLELNYLRSHRRCSSDDFALRSSSGQALTGISSAMRTVNREIELSADDNRPVLLEGLPGTGKSRVVCRIHALGRRQHLHHIPCAILSADWLSRELTNEDIWSDRETTLWLDEFATLPRDLQRHVHSRISEGCGPRVVASSSEDVERLVGLGQVSVRLYWKLAARTIRLPALAERLDDLPVLLEAIGQELARSLGRPPPVWSNRVVEALAGHTWPGNVSQLVNVIERAFTFAGNSEPTVADLTLERPVPEIDPFTCHDMAIRLSALGRQRIQLACSEADNDLEAAAGLLGVAPGALRVWLMRQGSAVEG